MPWVSPKDRNDYVKYLKMNNLPSLDNLYWTHESHWNDYLFYKIRESDILHGPDGTFLMDMNISAASVRSWIHELHAPHRYYHTYEHVRNMLAAYRVIDNNVPEVIAAIWLHDIVYDPKRSDNEESSAKLAHILLYGVNVDVKLVQEMILSTKTHDSDNEQCRILNDLDLITLGLRNVDYGIHPFYFRYACQIRQEYNFVPLDVYAKKRIEILELFDKRQIYKTSYFSHLEEDAHANIRDEIELLKSDPFKIEVK